jgi:hypothetical protein
MILANMDKEKKRCIKKYPLEYPGAEKVALVC